MIVASSDTSCLRASPIERTTANSTELRGISPIHSTSTARRRAASDSPPHHHHGHDPNRADAAARRLQDALEIATGCSRQEAALAATGKGALSPPPGRGAHVAKWQARAAARAAHATDDDDARFAALGAGGAVN